MTNVVNLNEFRMARASRQRWQQLRRANELKAEADAFVNEVKQAQEKDSRILCQNPLYKVVLTPKGYPMWVPVHPERKEKDDGYHKDRD